MAAFAVTINTAGLMGTRLAPARRAQAPAAAARVHAPLAKGLRIVALASDGEGAPSTRREALAGLMLGAGVLTGAPAAHAGMMETLKDRKRDTNAKYLIGPIRLSRDRLIELAKLTDGDSPNWDAARAALPRASLDCAGTSKELAQFSSVRDVCTYSIVYRSVTKGPAAKNDTDGPVATEAREALFALVSTLKGLDAVLQSGQSADAESLLDTKAAVTPAFTKVFDAIDRFELAVMTCMGYEPDLNRVIA